MAAFGLQNKKIPQKHCPWKTNVCYNATFTIGAEDVSEIVHVDVQLRDEHYRAITERAWVRVYLSDDAAGDSVVATVVDTIAIGTDGVVLNVVTGKSAIVVSEVDGSFDLDITAGSVTKTAYLVIVMPDGSLVVSGALTWAL